MDGRLRQWVAEFADTHTDATSLRIMRGQAIGAAWSALYLLDVLDPEDDWVPQVTKERDEALDAIVRIEARLTTLGAEFGDERSYGVPFESSERVQSALAEYRKNRQAA